MILLDRLRAYVEQETPSRDYARCAGLAERIGADLEAINARVELFDAPPNGKHVLAELGPAHGEPLLIMAHLDTVHPAGTIERQPFTIDQANDRVSGPGVYDMKSGLALMIEALAQLHGLLRLHSRIRVLVTCDEEIGSHTSRALIEAEARKARAVLVPEPSLPNGGVKTSRKGVATYTITARGRAAHAGLAPQTGINAINELAHQVIVLQDIADAELGTTLSVGTIQGGTATNVVPAEAVAAVDVRFGSAAEAARVDQALHALQPRLAGASLAVRQTESRPPLERSERVIALYQRARALAAELSFDLKEGGTGGGSDGSLAAAVGAATLDGLGPQGAGAHAIDEHVILSDLPFRLRLYTLLLDRL